MPLSCQTVLGIFGREGILVAAAPAKLGLALSLHRPACRLVWLVAPVQPRADGWKGKIPPAS